MALRVRAPHPWNVTPQEAVAWQRRLAGEVVASGEVPAPRYVAGVDVGFEDGGTITRAAVAILSFPELTLTDSAMARLPTSFPYIPGLLSFREVPAVLRALETVKIVPDVLLCDGQGTAHPRRFGIACHLGVLTGLPAVGVAKSRLIGTFDPVPQLKGAWQPLMDRGERIGAVLRTRVNTHPLFISPGHRIGLEPAIAMVMACTPRFRLPETTRAAHRLASGP